LRARRPGSPPLGDVSTLGQPPPEWAANASSWPAHHHDLSNTRATTQTPINSQTVHVAHDFKINGKATPPLQPGKTSTLVITFKKKAKYSYLCTVPGYAAAGMKGIFTVR
jgi:uncharacterized cupredoxin-like copper-binding protein